MDIANSQCSVTGLWYAMQTLSYNVFQVGCPEKIKKILFVQVTTAVFISSGFHSVVVTCATRDNSHFLQCNPRGGWNRKSKSHDLRARFLQAGSFWLPRQEFAGLFLEIWTLLANFALPSEGPRQVGYKKYFILPGLFCPGK